MHSRLARPRVAARGEPDEKLGSRGSKTPTIAETRCYVRHAWTHTTWWTARRRRRPPRPGRRSPVRVRLAWEYGVATPFRRNAAPWNVTGTFLTAKIKTCSSQVCSSARRPFFLPRTRLRTAPAARNIRSHRRGESISIIESSGEGWLVAQEVRETRISVSPKVHGRDRILAFDRATSLGSPGCRASLEIRVERRAVIYTLSANIKRCS